MPTIIDSLVVTLGLDASNFTKGQKDATDALNETKEAVKDTTKVIEDSGTSIVDAFEDTTDAIDGATDAAVSGGKIIIGVFLKTKEEAARAGKEMEAGGKQAAGFFASIKNEALALLGVLIGGAGLAEVVKGSAKSMADLGREAKNIGIPVPDLDAFGMAVARNGGNADAARQSLRSLTDEMERFKVFGQSSLIQFLNPIGAQRGDTAIEVFKKFSAFAATHKNDVPLINLIGKGLGFDQGTINEAMRGREQVERDLAESYKIGTVDKGMADRAAELQRDWEGLSQRIKHTTDVFVDQIEPALDGFIKWIDKKVDALNVNPPPKPKISDYTKPAPSGERRSPADIIPDFFHWLRGDEPEPAPPPPATSGGSWWSRNAPTWLGGSPAASPPPTADVTMTPAKRAFLATLAQPESGGQYDIKNGGSRFSDYSRFPEGVGPGGTSTASGRYQFISSTWRDEQQRLGLPDFSPESQDKAAWDLAWSKYRTETGRDLEADLKSGGHNREIAAALRNVWPSLPGGSQSRETQPQFDSLMAKNYGSAGGQLPARATNTLTPANIPIVQRPDPSLRIRPGPTVAAAAAASTSTTEVNVNTINIHTQAKDAPGIAGDIQQALNSRLINQANRGLQ